MARRRSELFMCDIEMPYCSCAHPAQAHHALRVRLRGNQHAAPETQNSASERLSQTYGSCVGIFITMWYHKRISCWHCKLLLCVRGVSCPASVSTRVSRGLWYSIKVDTRRRDHVGATTRVHYLLDGHCFSSVTLPGFVRIRK